MSNRKDEGELVDLIGGMREVIEKNIAGSMCAICGKPSTTFDLVAHIEERAGVNVLVADCVFLCAEHGWKDADKMRRQDASASKR